jgi:hypothetical protein
MANPVIAASRVGSWPWVGSPDEARRPASIATGYIDYFVMVITDRFVK